MAHFSSRTTVEDLITQTINSALKELLIENKIADRVSEGYEVKGIFITNCSSDHNTIEYLRHEPRITLFDREKLATYYIAPGQASLINKPVAFTVSEKSYITDTIAEAKVIIAALKAKELLELDGIDSGGLFAWNVRHSLGRTKVNREISNTIQDKSKHGSFLLFHNGLTILAKDVEGTNPIKINNYTVVNGCQSLSTIYQHKDIISNDMQLLTRIIMIDPSSTFAQEITHHTNNQNSISARDLQSNSSHQRRLQTEFANTFNGDYFYSIKRGERTSGIVIIENELAARVMLAFDCKQPWNCHQTYQLFDKLHNDIFARPEVTALRIIVLHEIYQAVAKKTEDISYELMGKYKLSTFFMLYLLRQAIEESDDWGRRFCASPAEFIKTKDDLKLVKDITERIIGDLLIDLNAELQEKSNNGTLYYDYKSNLKSPKAVQELAKPVKTAYLKLVQRDRTQSFGKEWEVRKKASSTVQSANNVLIEGKK